MRLFRQRLTIDEFVRTRLTFLWSKDREQYWDAARRDCNDAAFDNVDPAVFYANMRAAYLQLIGLSVTLSQKGNLAISLIYHSAAKEALSTAPLIYSLSEAYNRAYGSDHHDGVRGMVRLFNHNVAHNLLSPATLELLYGHFAIVAQRMLAEARDLKLVASAPGVAAAKLTPVHHAPVIEAPAQHDKDEARRSLRSTWPDALPPIAASANTILVDLSSRIAQGAKEFASIEIDTAGEMSKFPDRQLRQDMTFAYEGTGNPYFDRLPGGELARQAPHLTSVRPEASVSDDMLARRTALEFVWLALHVADRMLYQRFNEADRRLLNIHLTWRAVECLQLPGAPTEERDRFLAFFLHGFNVRADGYARSKILPTGKTETAPAQEGAIGCLGEIVWRLRNAQDNLFTVNEVKYYPTVADAIRAGETGRLVDYAEYIGSRRLGLRAGQIISSIDFGKSLDAIRSAMLTSS